MDSPRLARIRDNLLHAQIAPHDDYSNYAALHKAGVLTQRSLDVLNELNGLRNSLVHDYDGISDEVIEEVDEWLSKRG